MRLKNIESSRMLKTLRQKKKKPKMRHQLGGGSQLARSTASMTNSSIALISRVSSGSISLNPKR